MAVEDKYVNAQSALNLPDEPIFAGGQAVKVMIVTFEVAAASVM